MVTQPLALTVLGTPKTANEGLSSVLTQGLPLFLQNYGGGLAGAAGVIGDGVAGLANGIKNVAVGGAEGVGNLASNYGPKLGENVADIGAIFQQGTPAPSLTPQQQQNMQNAGTRHATNEVGRNLATGLALGAGGAGLLALVQRLRREKDEPKVGPILQLETKAAGEKQANPDWAPMAKSVAMGGGTMLSFMLLNQLLEKQQSDELKQKRINAEQSFTKALTSALQPQGLRLTAKTASVAEMSDEDALMSLLDRAATEKVAGLGGELAWWLLPLAAGSAAVGANYGWRNSAATNPARAKLKDIERRKLLEAVNSPLAPLLVTRGVLPEPEEEEAKPAAEQQEEVGLLPAA